MKYSRRDFEKLRALQAEIKSLESTEAKPRAVLIFYKDYKTGKGVPKVDTGIDDGEDEARELQRKINAKRRKLVKAVADMEQFLDTVEDPTERAVLRYYYGDGLTQEEIGQRLNYSRSTIQYILAKFWEKNKE